MKRWIKNYHNKPDYPARVERFWHWVNHLPRDQYLRCQALCCKYLGGWVRGIGVSEKGKVYLVIC